MSTIASPRDSSLPRRPVPPQISTPTTSTRPSIDSPRAAGTRSESASPSRGPLPRRNRAALREYYNIKAEAKDDASSEYAMSVNDHDQSDVVESEMDQEGFDGEGYVRKVLEGCSLEELLRTYNGVLTDIRALDAEKKALVYDNYSKLIAATETIHKMRANMDPSNSSASTLDPKIQEIYKMANAVRDELRESMTMRQRVGSELNEDERKKVEERKRAKDITRRVVETPERLRKLVDEGKKDEARRIWLPVLSILEKWKEQGKGGVDVQNCIEDGEAALRRVPPTEKSWVTYKGER